MRSRCNGVKSGAGGAWRHGRGRSIPSFCLLLRSSFPSPFLAIPLHFSHSPAALRLHIDRPITCPCCACLPFSLLLLLLLPKSWNAAAPFALPKHANPTEQLCHFRVNLHVLLLLRKLFIIHSFPVQNQRRTFNCAQVHSFFKLKM